jgi:hypothetical protein
VELEELVSSVMDSRQYIDRLEQIAQSHKVLSLRVACSIQHRYAA